MQYIKESYKIMPENNQKKSLSPEQIDEIIEIVEKYNLGPTKLLNEPELEKLLSEAKTPEEKLEIIENLPFNKIMKMVEEILEGKTSVERLTFILRKNLSLPLLKAEKIAKEIKEKVLQLPSEEKKEKIVEKPLPPKRDIYREPIE
jgi:dissimilatory sulfite reductase (desulfoviridin) alpha/beta subunit